MVKASRRKKNRKAVYGRPGLDKKTSTQKIYSKEEIESIYQGLIERWVNHGGGDVAVMVDKSEVFLAKQEILNWKGWHPLNQKNIEKHQVLIKDKLAGKYQDANLADLLEEAGYEVIYK